MRLSLGPPQPSLTVIRCTTQRPRDIRYVFGETKICHFDVAIGTKQEVFRLQITVNDVERVQVVESEGNLGGVEFGNGVRESLELSLRGMLAYLTLP